MVIFDNIAYYKRPFLWQANDLFGTRKNVEWLHMLMGCQHAHQQQKRAYKVKHDTTTCRQGKLNKWTLKWTLDGERKIKRTNTQTTND